MRKSIGYETLIVPTKAIRERLALFIHDNQYNPRGFIWTGGKLVISQELITESEITCIREMLEKLN